MLYPDRVDDRELKRLVCDSNGLSKPVSFDEVCSRLRLLPDRYKVDDLEKGMLCSQYNFESQVFRRGRLGSRYNFESQAFRIVAASITALVCVAILLYMHHQDGSSATTGIHLRAMRP